MHSRRRTPPRGALMPFVLVVYALILLGGPFFHTHAAGTWDSRDHCAICVASQSVPAIDDPEPLVACELAPCGSPSPVEAVLPEILLTTQTTSRSPPA